MIPWCGHGELFPFATWTDRVSLLCLGLASHLWWSQWAHGEVLVLEGDVGSLPGSQVELGCQAVTQVKHVLLQGCVQASGLLEVPPLLAVQDDAKGEETMARTYVV